MHNAFVDAELERPCSGETHQVYPLRIEMPPITKMIDMEFFDMLMSDKLQDAQTLVEQGELAVQDLSVDMYKHVEQDFSSES